MVLQALQGNKVSPITALEFLKNLKRIWIPRPGLPPNLQHARLGLCVSGGPDSMALAFLFSQLLKDRLVPGLDVRAFTIDHKARKESTDEADQVSRWLQNMGLQANILTIQWPDDVDPSTSSRFETQARFQRYKVLNEAMLSNQLHGFVTGHHRDDQRETIMMRLVNATGLHLGLTGMDSSSYLPLNPETFGINHSGLTRSMRSFIPAAQSRKRLSHSRKLKPSYSDSVARIPTTYGGTTLLRPFLPFAKDRLVSTCETYDVPFVVDPTNADPKFTQRNAVRHLFSSYTLPRALQGKSLFSLSEKARRAKLDLLETSNEIISQTRLLHFDLESAAMYIAFPLAAGKTASPASPGTAPSQERELHSVAFAMSRIARLVEPQTMEGYTDSKTMLRFAPRLWPSLATGSSQKLEAFTCGEVHFWPISTDKFLKEHYFIPRFEDAHPFAERLTPYAIWGLSRRPPPDHCSDSTVSDFSLSHEPCGTADNPSSLSKRCYWSTWRLWDGRFWFRIATDAHHLPELKIRSVRRADMVYTRSRLRADTHESFVRRFERVLATAAPDRIRWTLPVIVDRDDQVLAFPTLHVRVPPQSKRPEQSPSFLSWEVLYKHVDPDVLRLMTGLPLRGKEAEGMMMDEEPVDGSVDLSDGEYTSFVNLPPNIYDWRNN